MNFSRNIKAKASERASKGKKIDNPLPSPRPAVIKTGRNVKFGKLEEVKTKIRKTTLKCTMIASYIIIVVWEYVA